MIELFNFDSNEIAPYKSILHFISSNELKEFISNRPHLEVLDVGCEIPLPLFYLHHNFKFKRYLGLERLKNESQIIENLKGKTRYKNTYKNAENFYSAYQKTMKMHEDDSHLPLIEFNKLISESVLLGWDLNAYLKDSKSQNDKFDLIFASNIFHFYTEAFNKDFELLMSRLKENGVVYIRVQTDYLRINRGFDINKFRDAINLSFTNGKMFEDKSKGNLRALIFINI